MASFSIHSRRAASSGRPTKLHTRAPWVAALFCPVGALDISGPGGECMAIETRLEAFLYASVFAAVEREKYSGAAWGKDVLKVSQKLVEG